MTSNNDERQSMNSSMDPADAVAEFGLKVREQDRLDKETGIKEREVALKEREFGRGKFLSNVVASIAGAIFGMVGSLGVAWMSGHFTIENTIVAAQQALAAQVSNNKAAADLEQQKAEAQRFIEFMKIDFNKQKADQIVEFLVRAGFVTRNDRNIGIYAYFLERLNQPATIDPRNIPAAKFFTVNPDDTRNYTGSGGPYGKINGGQPFETVYSYFQSEEMSDHCKKFDDVCQIYVGATADSEDILRAFHLPYSPFDVGRSQNILELITRLNKYNATHSENVREGRSAALMVIDALAGSANEERQRKLEGKPQPQ